MNERVWGETHIVYILEAFGVFFLLFFHVLCRARTTEKYGGSMIWHSRGVPGLKKVEGVECLGLRAWSQCILWAKVLGASSELPIGQLFDAVFLVVNCSKGEFRLVNSFDRKTHDWWKCGHLLVVPFSLPFGSFITYTLNLKSHQH